ncbi:MAG: hypothetical protein IJ996_00185 [Clostridia bacterium]|nr:hypothetical protein [Clostridia bacterium]
MNSYDIYVLLLCVVVYVMLVSLTAVMVGVITKQSLKLIACGAEDETIKKEYAKAHTKRAHSWVDTILPTIFGVLFILVFAFSIYVNIQEKSTFENVATLRVVNSASMSYKHEKNKYLDANGLNDQFDTFDIILTYKLPAEEDLKLYDIVVYEVDDALVVHRIVGIEEPTATHPERHFLLQGDAVERPDRFPVLYEQMRAIYRGQRVPFVGSLVSFMQSPAGWICVLLIIVATVVSPILDDKLEKARKQRYAQLLKTANTNQGQALPAPTFIPTAFPIPLPMPLYPVYMAKPQNNEDRVEPKTGSSGGKREK